MAFLIFQVIIFPKLYIVEHQFREQIMKINVEI